MCHEELEKKKQFSEIGNFLLKGKVPVRARTTAQANEAAT
jgi:hypothetical protein